MPVPNAWFDIFRCHVIDKTPTGSEWRFLQTLFRFQGADTTMRIDHFSFALASTLQPHFPKSFRHNFPFFWTYQPSSSTIAVLGLCLCRFAFHLSITKLLINRCSTNAVGFSSLVSHLFFINCNFHFAFNQLNH